MSVSIALDKLLDGVRRASAEGRETDAKAQLKRIADNVAECNHNMALCKEAHDILLQYFTKLHFLMRDAEKAHPRSRIDAGYWEQTPVTHNGHHWHVGHPVMFQLLWVLQGNTGNHITWRLPSPDYPKPAEINVWLGGIRYEKPLTTESALELIETINNICVEKRLL